jgi:hypothetical protein
MPEWTGAFAGAGLYPNLPEDLYHRDVVPEGSLSVTSSKLLLPPSCPALFKHAREHPHAATKAMDLGTVVHGLVLGTGQEVMVLEWDDYRTKAAKEARDYYAAKGKLPMLAKEYAEAQAIAQAVKEHDVAGGLFAEGDAEVSGFWQDPETGIWLRMRTDWTTHFGSPTIVDFKTTADVSPDEFARSAAKYGYHRQDPHYRDGLAADLECDPDEIDFVFVAVDVNAPHLVMVYRLDDEAVSLGREQNKIAREIYRDCTESGNWPTWDDGIAGLSLRYYDARSIERQINDWHN